ncbi:hypothetical protein TNCV_940251 [Trichonephila clavipes]|nr:hypothetical protein TNCV_940251 [Trichonephila clavipes]
MRSFSPCKKAEVKANVNAKLFSNREISRRLNVSEASVRRIKKKREELSPKRKKKCCRKSIFTPRSERSLMKICLENRFATTKVIKSQLQDINVNASERTVRRKLKDLNFKTCRPARKPKLTPAVKAKCLNWAKQWRDKDVEFWRSKEQKRCLFIIFNFDMSASVMKAHLKYCRTKLSLCVVVVEKSFILTVLFRKPYKNNDFVNHQRQGYWTSVRG